MSTKRPISQATKTCSVCGKGPIAGQSIARRGMARIKGGAGQKITGRNQRYFRPNLQPMRILVGGTSMRVLVCTKCIKADKVRRHIPQPYKPEPAAA